MPQGLQVFNESGQIVFDTHDRAVGGVTVLNTGNANGSHTVTPPAGSSVEFIFNYPGDWNPSGSASRWPSIVVSGNTISWTYNPSVPASFRISVSIYAVTY